jgi:hypothetical protein
MEPAAKPSPSKVSRTNAVLQALQEVPPWVWVLAIGCVIILAFCTMASVTLPANGLARALVSTFLLAIGVFGLIAAEIWVIPLIAFDAPLLSVLDFIAPFRVWGVAIAKLPRTRRPVYVLSWCLTGILGALFIVGGLWYWLPGKKREKFRLEGPVATVGSTEEGGQASSEEVYNQRQEVRPTKDPASSDDDDDPEPVPDKTTIRCVVLGYIPEKDGVSLVVGIGDKGRYRYAGVVHRGLNSVVAEQVRKRLAPLVRVEPAVAGLKVKAIWVEPRVFCDVTQTGAGTATFLPDPVFKELVPDPKKKPQGKVK